MQASHLAPVCLILCRCTLLYESTDLTQGGTRPQDADLAEVVVQDSGTQPNLITNGDFSVNSAWEYSESPEGKNWIGAYDKVEFHSPLKSYRISYPPNTTNYPGYWAAIEQTFLVPNASSYTLECWVKDNYAGPISGSVIKEVEIDGVSVWEYDTAGDDGWDPVSGQDVTSSLKGKSSATIRLKVATRTSELTYPGITVWWDDIAIIPKP